MEQVSLPLWVDEAWSCRHIAPNRRGLAFRASYLDESRSTEYLPNLYLCRDIVPCHFSCRRNRYSNEDIFFVWLCHFCVISAVLSVVTVHPLPTQSFVTPSQQTMPTCVILTRHTNTKTVHVQVCYLCSCRAMDACAYCPMRPKHEQHSDVKPLVYAPGTGQWHQGVRRLLLSSCYMVHGVSVHVRAIASCSGKAILVMLEQSDACDESC